MHFLNSVMLISCEMWPLLFLLLGTLMWLLGWLFGRSRVGKLREELDAAQKRNKQLVSDNNQFESDLKIVKSDYDRTNKSLITAKNDLDQSNNKLNSALSKSRMIETEKKNLISDKNRLISEKSALESERNKLKENSLDAADANISNKAIADLKVKLTETERALAACEASKIKEDRVSFVAPPPPIIPPAETGEDLNITPPSNVDDGIKISPLTGNDADINRFVSGDMGTASPTSSPISEAPKKSGQSGLGSHFKNDNLQIIEGVGPKIESILKDGGYRTWEDLANATDTDLQKVLDNAGPRYRMHNPKAWSDQARFASRGQWEELIQYQKDIDGNASEANSKAEKLYFKALGFAAAKPTDLKVVEGIGPKIESLLKNAGIQNWSALAESEVGRLQDILTSAGDRYRLADPTTWPKQAELAVGQKWTELKEYQDFLSGGKA